MTKSDLEYQILGQIIIDQTAGEYAFEKLKPEFFTDKENSEFFLKLYEIVKNEQEITHFTVGKKFEKRYIEIFEAFLSSTGLRTHVDMLREVVFRRSFVSQAANLISGNLTTKELLEGFEPILTDIADLNGIGGLVHCSEIVKDLTIDIEAEQNGKILGIKTGFPKLDNNGLTIRNGELIILGARPSVGKSALAWQIAVKSGVNVAFFSQEMKSKALLRRQLTGFTGIQSNQFKRKDMSAKTIDGLQQISNLPLWIDDSQGKTGGDILTKCKRFSAVRPLGLVVVDYLQLMSFPNSNSRREGIGDCTKKLKQIAQEMDCPVLCISSLKRTQEKNKPPTMEDLKETGDIEFDADVILLMHRNIFDPNGSTDLTKAKDRNDEVFKTNLIFDRQTTSFTEASKDDMVENNQKGFMNDY